MGRGLWAWAWVGERVRVAGQMARQVYVPPAGGGGLLDSPVRAGLNILARVCGSWACGREGKGVLGVSDYDLDALKAFI